MGKKKKTKDSPKKPTMSSGVAVSDECKTYFEDIKKAKKYRYVVFYIKEEKSIVVESVGDRDSSYDDYLNDLQKGGDGECRYGLYDYEHEHQCQGTTESSKKQLRSTDQSEMVVLSQKFFLRPFL